MIAVKPFFLLSFIIIYQGVFTNIFSQGIAVNMTGSHPDSSAQLDISSNQKGILIPRLTQAERELISKPAKALLIYNISSNCFEVNTGTAETPQWEQIVTLGASLTNDSLWKTGGNNIFSPDMKLGTLNNSGISIVTNNLLRLYVDSAQTRIGINTKNPQSSLHISTTDALILPSGNTQQRPEQPVPGMIRYNKETGKLEGYTSSGWKNLQ
jgi:hypothetical protein